MLATRSYEEYPVSICSEDLELRETVSHHERAGQSLCLV